LEAISRCSGVVSDVEVRRGECNGMEIYLLVGVHAGKAAIVAGVATLGGDSLDFLLGAECRC
jgi:hypothetical protein